MTMLDLMSIVMLMYNVSTIAVHFHNVVTDMLSPNFLFPPANPSNFSDCKCFSNRIPFSTEVYVQPTGSGCTVMKCGSVTSRSRSSKMRRQKHYADV